ncbi:hypothetical protein QQ045_001508 [Rhodiola kirilowii]
MPKVKILSNHTPLDTDVGYFDLVIKKSFKVIKRKESKGKEAFKFQRRKKRDELDRLKNSYLEELGKSNKSIQLVEEPKNSNKSNQLSEAERHLEVESGGMEEDERNFSQRKDIEEKGKYASADQMREEGTVPTQKLGEKELDEEDLVRRIKQRKEAEETSRLAWRLGIKGSLSEEGMIQFFDNLLEENYVERMKGK